MVNGFWDPTKKRRVYDMRQTGGPNPTLCCSFGIPSNQPRKDYPQKATNSRRGFRFKFRWPGFGQPLEKARTRTKVLSYDNIHIYIYIHIYIHIHIYIYVYIYICKYIYIYIYICMYVYIYIYIYIYNIQYTIYIYMQVFLLVPGALWWTSSTCGFV